MYLNKIKSNCINFKPNRFKIHFSSHNISFFALFSRSLWKQELPMKQPHRHYVPASIQLVQSIAAILKHIIYKEWYAFIYTQGYLKLLGQTNMNLLARGMILLSLIFIYFPTSRNLNTGIILCSASLKLVNIFLLSSRYLYNNNF